MTSSSLRSQTNQADFVAQKLFWILNKIFMFIQRISWLIHLKRNRFNELLFGIEHLQKWRSKIDIF